MKTDKLITYCFDGNNVLFSIIFFTLFHHTWPGNSYSESRNIHWKIAMLQVQRFVKQTINWSWSSLNQSTGQIAENNRKIKKTTPHIIYRRQLHGFIHVGDLLFKSRVNQNVCLCQALTHLRIKNCTSCSGYCFSWGIKRNWVSLGLRSSKCTLFFRILSTVQGMFAYKRLWGEAFPFHQEPWQTWCCFIILNIKVTTHCKNWKLKYNTESVLGNTEFSEYMSVGGDRHKTITLVKVLLIGTLIRKNWMFLAVLFTTHSNLS